MSDFVIINRNKKNKISPLMWSKTEDEILFKLVNYFRYMCMAIDYVEIAKSLPGRLPRDCKERCNKIYDERTKLPFTKEEDLAILEYVYVKGCEWRKIEMFMGKSRELCKKRYNELLSDKYPREFDQIQLMVLLCIQKRKKYSEEKEHLRKEKVNFVRRTEDVWDPMFGETKTEYEELFSVLM